MASKLRRTPLFGCDGNLGIPIIPKQATANGSSNKSQKSTSSYGYKHTSTKMEVAPVVRPTNTSSYKSSGVVSSDSGNSSANSSVSSSSSISAASRLQGSSRMNSSSSKISSSVSSNHRQTPPTPNKHVNFGGGNGEGEKKREKFLTAKYGAHQMALIRKRLRVEMWMYERLQELYGADDIEIDLDEVLDMEDEKDRRLYISELLRIDGNNVHMSPDRINIFVGDLLEKVKTL